MSFRARLRLFFVLIVIVPMLSVAIVLFRLIADNESGKADAAVAVQLRTAEQLYREATPSRAQVEAVGGDRVLGQAIRAGDARRARKRSAQLLASHHLARIVITRGGRIVVDVGRRDAIAPGVGVFTAGSRAGRRLGRLEIATATAHTYVRRIHREEGVEVVVRRGTTPLAASIDAAARASLPQPGAGESVDVAGRSYRAASVRVPGFVGHSLELTLLAPDTGRGHAIRTSFLIAGGILLGFLVLALFFALMVSRSLQAQIAAFLDAARRIAQGDFTARAPTGGGAGDEFSQLGEEFNAMSAQLSARLDELRQERARLETSLRRIGETFASNLDRDALLELVVRTSVDGVEAQGGRASTRADSDGELEERVAVGELEPLGEALRVAEADALRTGAAADASAGEAYALAHPLHGVDGHPDALGLVSVARAGRAFSTSDRELFGYLAGQAAVSIENVALHEATQRQAVTDGLTGLYNHRRFQEAIESEVERARRFGQHVGLVMLDIDDFKQVNDRYGHQQGDRVLAEVARVLRDSCREIDAPARYGGEELAVVLPQTDLAGAYNLAERVRAGIETLELPLPDGRSALRVSASFGVAAFPESAGDPRGLLARADAALYEAKRGGKNKTVRAG